MSGILDQLAQEFRDVQLVRSFLIASAALLVYDHVLTFPAEVRYIWPSERSLGKSLFLFNRYVVPCIVAIDLYELGGLATNLSVKVCKVWTLTNALIIIVSLAVVNLIVAIRVHALYYGAKWVAWVLGITWCLYVGATLAITLYLMLHEILPTVTPIPIVNICFGTIPRSFFSIWLPAACYELVTVTMTLARAWHHVKSDETTLIAYILYRDGFVYNASKLFVLAANILVFAFADTYLVLMLREWVLVIANIIGSRMSINLRQAPEKMASSHHTGDIFEMRAARGSWSVAPVTRSQDLLASTAGVNRMQSILRNTSATATHGSVRVEIVKEADWEGDGDPPPGWENDEWDDPTEKRDSEHSEASLIDAKFGIAV
ncbi:hypothetical protein DACRYDRAFT_21820 [Dacryopinax primogenitus]|uniref:DUF6533 domain-containing protein n=1 Tax=Dacryopinax primogenitus (strain DJM 731) TaxID=1858805 RepID=M5GA87_DACPD|nr:uncharacterized protein DACRYDRAFT_21820 [Dacryopinax primogenitus]EJU02862.1 hypothetical protein DACRYDRAFT_21820 [Dacryopinax primogenitus]